MASSQIPVTISIKHQHFTNEIDSTRGTGVKLIEITCDRAFFIFLKWVSHACLTKMIGSLTRAPVNQKFLKEHRTGDELIWIEKTTIRKDILAKIARLGQNGGLNKILIPIGEERKVASSPPIQLIVYHNLWNLLPNDNLLQGCIKPTSTTGQQQAPPQKDPTHTIIYFNTSIIIKRKHFHDDWFTSCGFFRPTSPHSCSLNPSVADRALMSYENEVQVNALYAFRNWYKVDKFAAKFYPWDLEAFKRVLIVPSSLKTHLSFS